MTTKTQRKVIISRGGTAEHEVVLAHLQIPDLWHIAMRVKSEAKSQKDRHVGALLFKAHEDILSCWNIAHCLKKEMLREAGEME